MNFIFIYFRYLSSIYSG